jgi:hypothetical protein
MGLAKVFQARDRAYHEGRTYDVEYVLHFEAFTFVLHQRANFNLSFHVIDSIKSTQLQFNEIVIILYLIISSVLPVSKVLSSCSIIIAIDLMHSECAG